MRALKSLVREKTSSIYPTPLPHKNPFSGTKTKVKFKLWVKFNEVEQNKARDSNFSLSEKFGHLGALDHIFARIWALVPGTVMKESRPKISMVNKLSLLILIIEIWAFSSLKAQLTREHFLVKIMTNPVLFYLCPIRFYLIDRVKLRIDIYCICITER